MPQAAQSEVRTADRPSPRHPELDQFVARLYRSGLSVAPDAFPRWALRQLRRVLPFDGALWGTGSPAERRFHTVQVLDLPADFPAALEATAPINPILPRILARLDTPVAMDEVCDDRSFFGSELYRCCFARYGIARILSTAHVDPRSGLGSLLSVYRRDRRSRFSEEEKALHMVATFHLFQAASHAFFLHLARSHGERPPNSAAAVVDRHGQYHEAQPRFLDLIEKHFPRGDATSRAGLPFPPPAPGRTVRVGDGLCAKGEALGELICVYVWSAGPLDALTAREREIVYAVTQGLSFKQAARRIGVAPSTVANHLYRIYRKLDVNSRSELAALVYPATSA